MTTPETLGEVSPESMSKTASSAVRSPADAKPAPPRTTGNTADQNRLNLAEESRSIYGTIRNWKVKMMWMDPAPFSKTAS